MSRVVRNVVGGVLILGSGLLAAWALYNLIRIGTCASGGPYVSARPCPPGTELKILSIFGAVFAALAGAAIAQFPGRGVLAWACGFLGIGTGIAVGALGPARIDDSTGATILGIALGGMMILFALPAIWALFAQKSIGGAASAAALRRAGVPKQAQAELAEGLRKLAAAKAQEQAGAREEPDHRAAGAAGAGIAEELESLAALRDSGTLTEAEFEAAKKRLLDRL